MFTRRPANTHAELQVALQDMRTERTTQPGETRAQRNERLARAYEARIKRAQKWGR